MLTNRSGADLGETDLIPLRLDAVFGIGEDLSLSRESTRWLDEVRSVVASLASQHGEEARDRLRSDPTWSGGPAGTVR